MSKTNELSIEVRGEGVYTVVLKAHRGGEPFAIAYLREALEYIAVDDERVEIVTVMPGDWVGMDDFHN